MYLNPLTDAIARALPKRQTVHAEPFVRVLVTLHVDLGAPYVLWLPYSAVYL